MYVLGDWDGTGWLVPLLMSLQDRTLLCSILFFNTGLSRPSWARDRKEINKGVLPLFLYGF